MADRWGRAVRDYLVKQGISKDEMSVMSFGPDQSRATKKESRRVEIAVVLD